MDPEGNLRPVRIVPDHGFETGDVGIIVGSGAEVLVRREAHPAGHDPHGASEDGHGREDRDHPENAFAPLGFHYL